MTSNLRNIFISKHWFCPECAGKLSLSESVDPNAYCLSCASGHRFFLSKHSNLSHASENASSLQLSHLIGKSTDEVAHFWLSDAKARVYLNDQLAELLSAFLENRCISTEFHARYCPKCGQSISSYEQSDIWVRGLSCTNGHTWGERGGQIGTTNGGEQISFRSELSKKVILSLATGWLKQNPYLDPQLHESIRPVLEALIVQCSEDVNH
jgi:rubredoxin